MKNTGIAEPSSTKRNNESTPAWLRRCDPTKAQTSIRATSDHDRMSINAKFPSGGIFKFSATRNGDNLVLGGSNNPVIAKKQQAIVARWISLKNGETIGQRHERIKVVLADCASVGALCAKIQAEASQA